MPSGRAVPARRSVRRLSAARRRVAVMALTVLALVLTTSACSTKGLVFRDADTITVLRREPDEDIEDERPATTGPDDEGIEDAR